MAVKHPNGFREPAGSELSAVSGRVRSTPSRVRY
ncbi:hypothetical protein BJY17_001510 [Agromyces hippuratus]|uniref:Uncharacterized protein n=1 Tax=Agromyces hippuratus TaxID=286438 RepID=A0A852WXX6_9MICO|nr:hypothetical protein [Agromyces hippuratus]